MNANAYATAQPTHQMPTIQNLDASLYNITPEESQKYLQIFSFFDKNNSNDISVPEMQKLMVDTKLPREVCSQIWNLSNPNG